MRHLLMLLTLAGLSSLALAMCPAPTMTQATAPNCALQAHTRQTRYMSMEGFLRWQRFQEQQAWVTPETAILLAKQQEVTCAMTQ